MAVCRRTYTYVRVEERIQRKTGVGSTGMGSLSHECWRVHTWMSDCSFSRHVCHDRSGQLFIFLALLLVWFLFIFARTHTTTESGTFPSDGCAWKGNRNVWNLHLGKKWPKKTGVQQNFTVGQLTCSRITDWPLASATSFFPTAREPKSAQVFFFFFTFSKQQNYLEK